MISTVDNNKNITTTNWSRAMSIEELSKIFNIHRNTMSKWLREQLILNRQLSARKWQVANDELPDVLKEKTVLFKKN